MAAKILVVDDQLGIRMLLKEFFAGKYQVEMAASGFEALEYVKKTSFSLIILDMKMPDLNGTETLKKIRKIYAQVPVIMMSGLEEQDVYSRIRGMGNVQCICKPFDLEDLEKMVNEMLGEAKNS
ncbi:MAG: response regulator [Desulfotomaculum sp.]|nr:response regulator [Desulfotomaculum sp.]